MQKSNLFIAILINAIWGLLIGAALLGGVGFLFGGAIGFQNGMMMGSVFGLIGSMGLMGVSSTVGYWMPFSRRLGKSIYAKQIEDDEIT